MCRLKCGRVENQLHLARCARIKPFWDIIFKFLDDSGVSKPTHRDIAIITGMWTDKNIGSDLARGTLRHAISEMYRLFILHDTESKRFEATAAALLTLKAVRRALVRRAAKIKKLHANRKHTKLTAVISKVDCEKYAGLISMDINGSYSIVPKFNQTISNLEAKLHAERQARKEQIKAKAGAKKQNKN